MAYGSFRKTDFKWSLLLRVLSETLSFKGVKVGGRKVLELNNKEMFKKQLIVIFEV